MDDTEEEQLRGITMKSSAISLLHMEAPRGEGAAGGDGGGAAEPAVAKVPYIINLIDSPGHVDFSTDVSTAVRLCDGALVIVDALEGVCVQTHAVLRQAWLEGVRPCLVLNKMDRLITELKMEPMDAYQHIQRILEQINVIASSLYTADAMATASGTGFDIAEEKEAKIFFAPERGNVVFCSAIDGWAFSLDDFARLFAEKTGLPVKTLRRALWGEYYFKPKTRKVATDSNKGKLRPMFVEMVLQTLWTVYNKLLGSSDAGVATKLVEKFGLSVKPRDLNAKDPRTRLQVVMRAWLPVTKAVLAMVVRYLPSPKEAQASRDEKLWPPVPPAESDQSRRIAAVRARVASCDPSPDAPCVVFVSKMIAVEASALPSGIDEGIIKADSITERGEAFVAFARVFSGTLTPESKLHILGPKYSPTESTSVSHIAELTGGIALFMMMGRDLSPLTQAPAGNLVGIVGLGRHILKTATLSSTLDCPSLVGLHFQSTPLVKVAIEPRNASDLGKLERGLRLLNQADPCVEVTIAETGELQLATLGELHLERCVHDLRTRFCPEVELGVSPPIVGFMETISMSDVPSKITMHTSSDECTVTLSAIRLPDSITRLLEQNSEVLKIATERRDQEKTSRRDSIDALADVDDAIETFTHALVEACEAEGGSSPRWLDFCARCWSFGPRRGGPNMFVNGLDVSGTASAAELQAKCLFPALSKPASESGRRRSIMPDAHAKLFVELSNAIVAGFQLATQAGPICGEPMWGVCFVLEHIEFHDAIAAVVSSPDDMSAAHAPVASASAGAVAGGQADVAVAAAGAPPSPATAHWPQPGTDLTAGPLSGQVISVVQEACRESFSASAPRLVEAMYKCELQCHSETTVGGASGDLLGKLYAVLGQRRGNITGTELLEGTQTYIVSSFLPIVESFGFATLLRKKTSGAVASPQLVFSHWEVLDEDPKTDDETNKARELVEAVRRRKGLSTSEKIVVHAEKQRNLARKK